MLTNRTFSTKAYDARYFETDEGNTELPPAYEDLAAEERAIDQEHTEALRCDCIDSDAWVCFRGQNIVGMELCPCPCHKEAEDLERAELQIEHQRENS